MAALAFSTHMTNAITAHKQSMGVDANQSISFDLPSNSRSGMNKDGQRNHSTQTEHEHTPKQRFDPQSAKIIEASSPKTNTIAAHKQSIDDDANQSKSFISPSNSRSGVSKDD